MTAERISDPEVLARVLAGGGLVLLQTDTLPGVHCRHDSAAAVARLNALKARSPGKPLLLLCGGVADALALAAVPLEARVERYARRCWPGPFTLILPAGPGVPAAVRGGGPTVALRVPALAALRRLVAAVGAPLVSTSANRSGQPPCSDLDTAAALLGDDVDIVGELSRVDGDSAGASDGLASCLIDLTSWPPRVLRDGPVPPPSWDDSFPARVD